MENVFSLADQILLRALRQTDIIKIGELTRLKDGSNSPIYIDMRDKLTDLHPEFLFRIGQKFFEKIQEITLQTQTKQCLIGVPYTGYVLACATVMAAQRSIFGPIQQAPHPLLPSLIIQRKDVKGHGTVQERYMVGEPRTDREYNLIDDTITTNKSKLESLEPAEKELFKIKRILVFIDRQQGGGESLQKMGYEFHSIFKVLEVAEFFLADSIITLQQYNDVVNFIATH